FTSFRAAQCQAPSPVKTLQQARVMQVGTYWRFDFQADAFLHHMIRNILGCVLQVGAQKHPPEWINEVLAARSRDAAAPTFAAAGLYFLGPVYAPDWGLPEYQAQGWLPGD
ncbi:MAG: tRNA pseudouridine(38-40) synthase TruA, partial [Burkholderiaceae bacterium]